MKMRNLIAAAVVMLAVSGGGALGSPISSAGSGLWTNPASWTPQQVPTINDDVTIQSGHTNTIATNVTLTVASLTIQTNGALTHLANSTIAAGTRYKLVLNIVNGLTIDAGGQLLADAKGYSGGNGPGGAPGYGNGGSYGGKGGYYSTTAPGPTYGSIIAPTDIGSGGGKGGTTPYGGGAIQVTVGGASAINGSISAGGMNGGEGGGSGGSVFLTTATLTGTGVIRANGGGGNPRGGGGRVAVVLTGSTDFGRVMKQAFSGGAGASAGTVYLQHTGHAAGQGRLIVDYNDVIPPLDVSAVQNGTGASAYAFSEIVLTNGAVYMLDANDSLDISATTISADPTDRNEGIYVGGGTLTVPAAFGWSNCFIAVGATTAGFNPALSLRVGTNATLKIDRPFTLNCPVALEPGGWLSHSVNGATDVNRMGLTIRGNLDIPAGAAVNVDGVGYYRGYGPGGLLGYGTGGSHGGRGGLYSGGYGRLTFGSITSPTNCGGGGGTGYASEGGGAACLNVLGTTTVYGVISANGLSVGEGGGAGGSVFLTTAELIGDGMIRANGGSGNPSGGGGRIAVILTNGTVFGSARFEAYAGTSGTSLGAGGTIYLQHKDHAPGQGKLIVDYLDRLTLHTVVNTMQNGNGPSSYAFSEIVLTNGAVYALDTNDTLNLAGTVVSADAGDRNEGIYAAGGSLTVPAAFVVSNYFIAIAHTNTVFLPAVSLTVGTNATMRFDVPWTVSYPLILEPGGWLGHSPNVSAESNKLTLTINGNWSLPAGAFVNVDGMGYAAGFGKGAPASGYYGGAGYGGRGGQHDPGNPGSTYGSITAPTNCGSGSLSAGGGSVRLIVNGGLALDGVISANGDSGGCSGSGGSIYLTASSLTGTGMIRANGGLPTWGGGGGGRLAVELTNSAGFGAIVFQARGGNSSKAGAAGTIYLKQPDQAAGQGTLIVDAGNIVPGTAFAVTLINSNVTDTVVGTVIITNQARFRIETNRSLTVNGSWTNAAVFLADTNSSVILAGAGAATVAGSNAFYNLACTNARKIVSFQAGKTNIVNGFLALGTAAPGETVTLQSTAGGSPWFLRLGAGGSQQMARVTVRDGNASGGATLLAGKGSVNLGNNVNWEFPKIAGTVVMLR